MDRFSHGGHGKDVREVIRNLAMGRLQSPSLLLDSHRTKKMMPSSKEAQPTAKPRLHSLHPHWLAGCGGHGTLEATMVA